MNILLVFFVLNNNNTCRLETYMTRTHAELSSCYHKKQDISTIRTCNKDPMSSSHMNYV